MVQSVPQWFFVVLTPLDRLEPWQGLSPTFQLYSAERRRQVLVEIMARKLEEYRAFAKRCAVTWSVNGAEKVPTRSKGVMLTQELFRVASFSLGKAPFLG